MFWTTSPRDFSRRVPCEQRFLFCMAFSVYEVVRVACLLRSWFVYSLWETSAESREKSLLAENQTGGLEITITLAC